MEYLSKTNLEARTKDIFTNMATLNEKGKIGFYGINNIGEYWMVKWTCILEEFVLRYGPYPNGFTNGFIKKASFVKPSCPKSHKAKIAIDSVGGISEGCLYKFGKSEHLKKMFQYGNIRIAPSSLYDDPSLNYAIRDNELSLTIEVHPNNVKITDNIGKQINPIGNVSYQIESTTNYYVYCLAADYTYREYDDFEADTCIIIREPDKFIDKIIQCFEAKVAGFKSYAKLVHYIDPLQVKEDDVEPFMHKHFKYSYQNEFRVIWLPDTEIEILDPVFIEIGNMEEYADILYI